MKSLILIAMLMVRLASLTHAAEIGDLRAESVWTHAGAGKLVQIVEYAPSLLTGEAWSSIDGAAGLYWIPPNSERLYELWTKNSGASSTSGPSYRKYELAVATSTRSTDSGLSIKIEVWNSVPSEPERPLEESLWRARNLFIQEGFGWREVTHGTVQVVHGGITEDFALDLPARAQIEQRIRANKGILVSLPNVRRMKYIFGAPRENIFLSIDGSPYRGGRDTYDYFLTDENGTVPERFRRSWIVDARDTMVEFDSGLQFFWPNSGDSWKQAYLLFPGGKKVHVDSTPESQWTDALIKYLELPASRYREVTLESPCPGYFKRQIRL